MAAMAGPKGEAVASPATRRWPAGLGQKTKSRRPLMSKRFRLKRLSPMKRFVLFRRGALPAEKVVPTEGFSG